jgi:exopolysaccharide biosynthesis polyprenyl glycosylphosphotransferase
MTSITRQVPGEPESVDVPLTAARGTIALEDDILIIQDPPGSQPTAVEVPARSERELPHRARASRSLRRRLVAGDILALSLVWGIQAVTRGSGGLGRQLALGALAVVVTLFVMQCEGLYRSRVCALRSLEAFRVVSASAIGTAAFISCDAIIEHVSVVGPLEAGAAAVLAILLLRWRFNRWLSARRSASKFLRPVVMVGTNKDAEGLWQLLNDEPELGYQVAGVAGEQQRGAPWEGLPSTPVERLGELAREVEANGVIIVASSLVGTERKKTVDDALAAGLHVQVWAGLDGFSSRRTRMAPASAVPLLYVEPTDRPAWQLGVKRAMDIILAGLLLLLTAPLIAAAALAIKLTDRGPVLYRSQRVGRYGKIVMILKLRTMVPDASKMMVNVAELNERKGGPLFKATSDPRVTKIGHLLRATSIDELPQLWNVLNGTMSLVGPRPALPQEVEQFDSELMRRHEMRPGITGLWQVEARDNPSFSAYRRHDLSYVDDWSLALDMAIAAGTVHQLVARSVKAVAQLAKDRKAPLGNEPATTSATAATSAATSPGELAGESS